jgi:hypothetical protein
MSLPFNLLLVLGIIGAPGPAPSVTSTAGVVAEAPASTETTEGSVNVKSRLAERYDALPTTLDRQGLAEGFHGVSRSVDQCVSRQLKIEGAFHTTTLSVNVTVSPTGKVSRLKLPRPVRKTIFGACMQAHSSRWRFPPFTGRPVKASKRFIVR